MMVGAGVIAILVPTLIGFGQDPMFGILLLSSMWPIGLLGHYLIGVIDHKIGTKKTALVVIAILGLGGLITFVGGHEVVACAISTGMFMFGLSGSLNVCTSLTVSIFRSCRLRNRLYADSGHVQHLQLRGRLGYVDGCRSVRPHLRHARRVHHLRGCVRHHDALPYRQIGSKIHGDEEVANAQ